MNGDQIDDGPGHGDERGDDHKARRGGNGIPFGLLGLTVGGVAGYIVARMTGCG